ncbi:MAG: transglycosylase domain-containing protein [Pseudomonadota bacterium]
MCWLAYLVVVAAWASASFDDAMSSVPVAIPSLSTRQTEILLRVEDPTFYQHSGLSLADGQGLATISSAVASQVFLSDRRLAGMEGALQRFYRGVFDCCKRADFGRDVMALVLNAKLSKDKQLALYVSEVYMGTNRGQQVKGLTAAAQSYLGKPLQQTTEQEFIGLVAMIKAPNWYHPVRNPAAHLLRAARIQALLSGKCKPDGWFDTSYNRCTP